jgi:hypothetical protein
MKTLISTLILLVAFGCSKKETMIPEEQEPERTVIEVVMEKEVKDSTITEVIDEAPAEEVAPVVEETVPVIEETEETPVEEVPAEDPVIPDEVPDEVQEEGDSNG